MITKDMSSLDFTKSAEEIHNTIRGVSGFTMMNGKRLKVFSSEISHNIAIGEAGTIVDADKFAVSCGDGVVLFTEIQLEGAKRMKTADFLRGRKQFMPEIQSISASKNTVRHWMKSRTLRYRFED